MEMEIGYIAVTDEKEIAELVKGKVGKEGLKKRE